MAHDISFLNRCSGRATAQLINLFSAQFQTSSNWSLSTVTLKDVTPLCKYVFTERLNYAKNSILACGEHHIPLFYPYIIQYTDGSVHLVAPPIVEERDGALFLGDGMHRFYCALALNIETAYVLVTHKCELPFPGVPQVWENISEVSKQLPVQCNFEGFLRSGLTGYSKFCNSDVFWLR